MFVQQTTIVFLLVLAIFNIYIHAKDLKCLTANYNKVELVDRKDNFRCAMVFEVDENCASYHLMYTPLTEEDIKYLMKNYKQPNETPREPVKATDLTKIYKYYHCMLARNTTCCAFISESTLEGSFDEFKSLVPHCTTKCSHTVIEDAKYGVFGHESKLDPAIIKPLVGLSSATPSFQISVAYLYVMVSIYVAY